MSIKIGINGFGRIGRLVLRAGINREGVEFVGINDPFISPDYMAYMLKYDSVHGRFQGAIEVKEDAIVVNGHEIKVFNEMDAKNIPWAAVGAEYIVEATGINLTKERLRPIWMPAPKRSLCPPPPRMIPRCLSWA